jgi:hypothetical protein
MVSKPQGLKKKWFLLVLMNLREQLNGDIEGPVIIVRFKKP